MLSTGIPHNGHLNTSEYTKRESKQSLHAKCKECFL